MMHFDVVKFDAVICKNIVAQTCVYGLVDWGNLIVCCTLRGECIESTVYKVDKGATGKLHEMISKYDWETCTVSPAMEAEALAIIKNTGK